MAALARETFTMALLRMQRGLALVRTKNYSACGEISPSSSEKPIHPQRWNGRRGDSSTRWQTVLARLRAPEAHGANQSPPLMPAQAKNAEQATCDRRALRNDETIYLDVIDLVLEIGAIGLSPGECQSHDERRLHDSRSGREGES